MRPVEWMKELAAASLDDLRDASHLVGVIRRVGLFYDDRPAPEDPGRSIYGSDVTYMLRDARKGVWQTPCQLAAFLVDLSSKNVQTYLELGPCSGWTTAFVVTYLARFGLRRAVALDVYDHLDPDVRRACVELDVPLTFAHRHGFDASGEWDLVFIDAEHTYRAVVADFEEFSPRARLVAFHDINDWFCPGVRAAWAEFVRTLGDEWKFTEYLDHPDGFRLMGIGVMEKM